MNPSISISESSESMYPSNDEWGKMDESQKLSYMHDCLLELYLNVKIRNFEKV